MCKMRMGESSISRVFSKPAKIYSHLPRSLTVALNLPYLCFNLFIFSLAYLQGLLYHCKTR